MSADQQCGEKHGQLPSHLSWQCIRDFLFFSSQAFAQTTNCNWVGSTWTCNTVQPPLPIRGVDGGALIDAMRRGREDRQSDEQRRAAPQPLPQPALSITTPNDLLETGNGLLSTCQSAEPPLQVICGSFIKGLVEGSSGALEVGHHPQLFCAPPGATIGQDRDIIIRFLLDNPQWRHLSATAISLKALGKAFPCGQN